MSSYLTDAGEYVRRQRLDERSRRTPQTRRPLTRTRVASTLRHVADRLDG